MDFKQLLPRLQLAVVAPFPSRQRVNEGWMSRIASQDKIFSDVNRLYLNISPYHISGHDDVIRQHTENAWEVCVSASDPLHQGWISELTDSVSGIYVHTCHLAEYIVPWLASRKYLVDMHGIAPEEEIMLGRPELAPALEAVEKAVLENCSTVIVVTDTMADHFRKKYPGIRPNYLTVPIFESYKDHPRVQDSAEFPLKVVYAGGVQTWQNLDAMLHLYERTSTIAEYTFLSHASEAIKKRALELGVGTSLRCMQVPKVDLPAIYSARHFGLVLRDDTPVNRVSCPTKLGEYMNFGLIPIVRSAALGDYLNSGYAYVTEDQFLEGYIPDDSSRTWMIDHNKRVFERLRIRYFHSTDNVRAALGIMK
jgi:hypothetical protein